MPEGRISVLVVAGDAGLRETIRAGLSPTGFDFDEASSGIEATAKVLRGSYHLVLIGLGEDTRAGFEICSHLRTLRPNVRLVAIRSTGPLQNEIDALEAGADDCVSIPIRFREVVGRLRAVLGRPETATGAVGAILRAGDLKLDTTSRICWRARNKIHLSPREFDLLAALMKHPEHALTHARLLVAVWGQEVKHDPDYLRSYIKTLREKIESDPAKPEYILTVPWVGYMLCDPRRGSHRQHAPSVE
jgi:two-component system KDP operon response regulator KdpE